MMHAACSLVIVTSGLCIVAPRASLGLAGKIDSREWGRLKEQATG